jgi:hypothetical protein
MQSQSQETPNISNDQNFENFSQGNPNSSLKLGTQSFMTSTVSTDPFPTENTKIHQNPNLHSFQTNFTNNNNFLSTSPPNPNPNPNPHTKPYQQKPYNLPAFRPDTTNLPLNPTNHPKNTKMDLEPHIDRTSDPNRYTKEGVDQGFELNRLVFGNNANKPNGNGFIRANTDFSEEFFPTGLSANFSQFNNNQRNPRPKRKALDGENEDGQQWMQDPDGRRIVGLKGADRKKLQGQTCNLCDEFYHAISDGVQIKYND